MMDTYLINYKVGDKEYSFNLPASSWADAESKLESIRYDSWVEGKLEKVTYYEH